ncbi:PAS domain-containing protein [Saccharopolyspora sp. ASAGF58]|uniref:PAS domain-containing protein n=1 Tax=Saccharopolyspora sp. ASAGF58 TaxID=2719023 RepID=UPI001FF09CA9|nr:PAS domain-containing protein [Saccharopolyspora sp. ASAGF58]
MEVEGAATSTNRRYAIFALDADGMVTSWNADAERMKGYLPDEIIGRHFSVFYPADLVAAGYPQAELEQAAEASFYVDDGWRVRKDGTQFWAHVVITAQRDAQGVLTGFIKVTRNDSDVGGLL